MAQDTNAPHEHPHAAIPVRIAKESSFAGPGSDAPAETQRPKRDAGTDQDHPINKALRDEDKSLIGPQLGRGGTGKPMRVPALSGDPGAKFVPGVGPALARAPQFVDVSSLIGKTRGS
jgi:hypothetical protein